MEILRHLDAAATGTLSEIAGICRFVAGTVSSRAASEAALLSATRAEARAASPMDGPSTATIVDPVAALLHREVDDASRVLGISRPDDRDTWAARRARLTATQRSLENHALLLTLITGTFDEIRKNPSYPDLLPHFRLAVLLRAGLPVPAALAEEVTCATLRGFDSYACERIAATAPEHLRGLLALQLSTLTDVSVHDAMVSAAAAFSAHASLPTAADSGPSSR